jgi:hypothetical protein
MTHVKEDEIDEGDGVVNTAPTIEKDPKDLDPNPEGQRSRQEEAATG